MLQELNLEKNNITSFPTLAVAFSAALDSLVKLELEGNEAIRDPPYSIAKNSDKLLQFLRDLRRGAALSDSVAVPIVGHGGHGKSTLSLRLYRPDGESDIPANLADWSAYHVQHWCATRKLPPPVFEALAECKADGKALCDENGMERLLDTLADEQDGDALHAALSDLREELALARDEGRRPYISTIGVVASERRVPFPVDNADDGDVKPHRPAAPEHVTARLLDFAGQLEYYATHGVLLASVRAVYVCVARVTGGELDPAQAKTDLGVARASLHHWMSFVRDMVPHGARVPVVPVLTHVDAVCDWALSRRAARKMLLELRDEFAGHLDVAVPEAGDPAFFVDYSAGREDTLAAVRRVVDRLVVEDAAKVAVPAAYLAARHAVTALDDPSQRGAARHLVPLDRVRQAVVSSNPQLLEDNDALRDRAISYLEQSGSLLVRGEWCVLDPMAWFATVMALLVYKEEGGRQVCPLLQSLQGGVSAQQQQRPARAYSLLYSQSRDDGGTPGFIGWRRLGQPSVLKHLECADADELLRVLGILAGVGLCYIVRVEDRVRGAWFPTLLQPDPEQSLARRWTHPEESLARLAAGGRTLGRRVRAARGGRLPAGLFPALQMAVLRRFADAASGVRLDRDHLHVVFTDEAGHPHTQLLLVRNESADGGQTRIDMVARGTGDPFVSVLRAVHETLLMEEMSGYAGFVAQHVALCPVDLGSGRWPALAGASDLSDSPCDREIREMTDEEKEEQKERAARSVFVVSPDEQKTGTIPCAHSDTELVTADEHLFGRGGSGFMDGGSIVAGAQVFEQFAERIAKVEKMAAETREAVRRIESSFDDVERVVARLSGHDAASEASQLTDAQRDAAAFFYRAVTGTLLGASLVESGLVGPKSGWTLERSTAAEAADKAMSATKAAARVVPLVGAGVATAVAVVRAIREREQRKVLDRLVLWSATAQRDPHGVWAAVARRVCAFADPAVDDDGGGVAEAIKAQFYKLLPPSSPSTPERAAARAAATRVLLALAASDSISVGDTTISASDAAVGGGLQHPAHTDVLAALAAHAGVGTTAVDGERPPTLPARKNGSCCVLL